MEPFLLSCTEAYCTAMKIAMQGLTRINIDYGKAYQNENGDYVVSASGILNLPGDALLVIHTNSPVVKDNVSVLPVR